MQTIRDLVDALNAGQRPVVTFKNDIGDKESYAEAGMRARILSHTAPDKDGVLKINFEFAEFDAHNTAFESANYYDKSHNAVLTARQAGFYHPQDHMYFDLDEQLGTLMQLEDNASVALFQAYKAEGCTGSYISWLERKVLAAQTAA